MVPIKPTQTPIASHLPWLRLLSRRLGGVARVRLSLHMSREEFRALLRHPDPLSLPTVRTMIRSRLGFDAPALRMALRDEERMLEQERAEMALKHPQRRVYDAQPRAVARLVADAEAKPLEWRR